jgi:phosphatidylserine decarboxylase
MPAADITFFNRHTRQIETEVIYGESFLRFVYGNAAGRLALHTLVKRALFSQWYGRRMDSPKSAAKVRPFIAEYGLDAAQFADPVESYRSFNDFFYRKLKPSARPIDSDPQSVVFPADGRHLLVPDVTACDHWMIKGQRFDLATLLGDAALAAEFAHGSALVSRLCPVDYHRFHFPCDAMPDAPRLIDGPLYSVSPLALLQRPGILWQNKRAITRLHDGALFLEVGATCVGSIVHTNAPGTAVAKGAEKGYFRFGGSCVITLFKAGAVKWDADLIEHSAAGRELYAWMGERCGGL